MESIVSGFDERLADGLLEDWAEDLCAKRQYAQSGGIREVCARLKAAVETRDHRCATRLLAVLTALPVTLELLKLSGTDECVERLTRSGLADKTHRGFSVGMLASHLILQWGRMADHECTVEVIAGPVMPPGTPPFVRVVQTTAFCSCAPECLEPDETRAMLMAARASVAEHQATEGVLQAKLTALSEQVARSHLSNTGHNPSGWGVEPEQSTDKLLATLGEVRQQLRRREEELETARLQLTAAEHKASSMGTIDDLHQRISMLRDDSIQSAASARLEAEQAEAERVHCQAELQAAHQRIQELEAARSGSPEKLVKEMALQLAERERAMEQELERCQGELEHAAGAVRELGAARRRIAVLEDQAAKHADAAEALIGDLEHTRSELQLLRAQGSPEELRRAHEEIQQLRRERDRALCGDGSVGLRDLEAQLQDARAELKELQAAHRKAKVVHRAEAARAEAEAAHALELMQEQLREATTRADPANGALAAAQGRVAHLERELECHVAAAQKTELTVNQLEAKLRQAESLADNHAQEASQLAKQFLKQSEAASGEPGSPGSASLEQRALGLQAAEVVRLQARVNDLEASVSQPRRKPSPPRSNALTKLRSGQSPSEVLESPQKERSGTAQESPSPEQLEQTIWRKQADRLQDELTKARAEIQRLKGEN